MTTSSEQSHLTASPDPDWPSHRLRWVLLGAFLGLLGLILISGAAASRTLKRMQQQEQLARRDVAERTRNLSGLYLSIEVYNEAIQRYAACPEGKPDPVVRQQVDRLTADIGSQLDRYPSNRQPEEAAFLPGHPGSIRAPSRLVCVHPGVGAPSASRPPTISHQQSDRSEEHTSELQSLRHL